MKRVFFICAILTCSHSAYSYDYLKNSGVTTEAELCKMYREFNLQECKKQAATVKDHFDQPKCDMWDRERESALADCNGTSESAKMEKKRIEEVQALRSNATHVLVEKGRLVCSSEKSFRNTFNYIVTRQPGAPPHILSGGCKVLQYEPIVKINKMSEDEKVVGITYLDNFGVIRHGFTAPIWLVTRERYNEIAKQRKEGLL
jgi:hypothetical protein